MKTVNQLRLGSPIVNASPDTPASLEYVQSRGTDLVTNGSGTLGTNYNFSAWTFTAADAPTGAAGSFLCAPNVQYGIFLDEFMPVDPAKKLMYAFKARQTSTSDVATMYGMLVPYDAYKNVIYTHQYMFIAATQTTLAVDLNPGDPTITLTSAANWYGSAGKPAAANTHWRSIIWWDYVDAGGKAWPIETYSRNASGSDYWSDGSLVGNVITLKVPYAGPAKVAGTPLSNGSAGGTYMYGGAIATVIPKVWTPYSVTIVGLAAAGVTASFAAGWPAGVGYCKAGFLVNYTTSANSRHAVAAVSLSDAAAANAAATAAIPQTWRGLVNGVASLDAATKIPVAQMPAGLTAAPIGIAAGDLGGTYPNPTVIKHRALDTRAVVTIPNDYFAVSKWAFKDNAVIGLPAGNGTYSVVNGFRGYADASGGPAFEYAYTSTGNTYRRWGLTTTWSAWFKVDDFDHANVFDDDIRLSDARNPLTHNQSADTITASATKDTFLLTERTKLTGIATAATANATDASLRDRATHTGNMSADNVVDGATNHVFTNADNTKLTGIATAATANATDVSLRDRATHTGNMSADNVVDGATNHVFTNADNTKLIGIATGANVNLAVGTGAGTVAAGNDSRFGTGTPTGTAGGDLAGTYPNPTIKPLTIVDGDVAVANKDGLANVPSMRTLGTGAQQAAAGTHNQSADTITASATKDTFLLTERTKLTGIATGANVNLAVGTGAGTVAAGDDSRFGTATPTGTAGGDLAGTYPNPTIKPLTIVDGDVAVANKDGLAAVPSMRTLGTSAQQAVAGTDSRLADARNPLSHNHSTSEVTSGILPVARGGTNTDIVPILNGVVYGDGTKYKSTAASVIAKSVLRATTIGGVPLFGVIDLSYMPKAWPKEGVWQATTVNVVLSGEQFIDGEPGYAGFRYLVKNQTNPIENGIYIMEIGAWTRTLDTDTGSELLGAMVPVAGGLTQKGTRWTTTFDVNVGDTVGSSPMLWFEVAQRADQIDATIATALAEVTIIDGGAP